MADKETAAIKVAILRHLGQQGASIRDISILTGYSPKSVKTLLNRHKAWFDGIRANKYHAVPVYSELLADYAALTTRRWTANEAACALMGVRHQEPLDEI